MKNLRAWAGGADDGDEDATLFMAGEEVMEEEEEESEVAGEVLEGVAGWHRDGDVAFWDLEGLFIILFPCHNLTVKVNL